MATTLEVSYFNTFWLKRLKNFTLYQERQPDGTVDVESGGTTIGTPDLTTGEGYIESNVFEDWFLEEARIEGGFNNTSVDFGNKAYIVEEEDRQTRRQSSIIYSGVYNAKNGINNTNQFPIGEEITRSVDPASGSIQKLFAENTNLIILQERKVNRAPVDKDVIFTQEGLPLSTDAKTVVGTPSAFEGNFGISRDPGSFAHYGYNKYFTDRDRGVVLQLGPNGLNPISNYGMIDYFRDTLSQDSFITAGYDVYNKNYTLTIEDGFSAPTVVFDDIINGWVSRMEYAPDLSTSSRGLYYTFKDQAIWQQNADTSNYNNFYGIQRYSSVSFVFNPDPVRTKTFTTINYTGSNGWRAQLLASDYTGIDTNPQQPGLGDTTYTDRGQTILSYDDGYYTENGIEYRAGFNRKQNIYYAAIKGTGDGTLGGQVLTSSQTTGLKAQFLTLTMQQDSNTAVQSAKQLFSVGAVYSNR
tara:strand:+ start:5534 stop:6940 length:1407 start_codon:yes stop_codon:yes gene_type:complete